MEKKSSLFYTYFRSISVMALVIVVMCMSCSKDTDEPVTTVPTPTPPVATPPSGMIDNFTVTDSLMPFYTPGATLKWLVTGTNSLTVVTINGVKVAYNGILAVGPLKKTTIFTLLVNNGTQASVVVNVADSITTLLWNKGKRLKLIKKEYGYYPIGSASPVYRDTAISFHEGDERILFYYNNYSEVVQKTSNTQVAIADGGKFTVSRDQQYFSWRNHIYYINILDANFLFVDFDEPLPNGTKLKMRHTYQYE